MDPVTVAGAAVIMLLGVKLLHLQRASRRAGRRHLRDMSSELELRRRDALMRDLHERSGSDDHPR